MERRPNLHRVVQRKPPWMCCVCVRVREGERERERERDLPYPVSWFLGTHIAEPFKDSWALKLKTEPWPGEVVVRVVRTKEHT